MGADPEGGLLGRLAVYYKLITMAQLTQATDAQLRTPSKRLGEIFVGAGWITEAQLQQLLEAQRQYVARAKKKREASRPVAVAAVQPPPSSPTSNLTSVAAGTARSSPMEQQYALDPSTRDMSGLSMTEIVASANQTASHETPGDSEGAAVRAVEPAERSPLSTEKPHDRRPKPAARASAKPTRVQRPAADARSLEWLNSVLGQAAKVGASDVHIHSNATIKLRRFRKLVEFTQQPLPEEQATAVINSLLDDSNYQRLHSAGEVDAVYAIDGVGRFRVNAYKQRRGINAVFHFVPARPPTLEELGLPSTLAKVTNFHQGLVLITGPAGCGKSSTLAALVNIINEERNEHILTIEDPVEYIHPTKRCLVNQRQVKKHTESFARALRAALREDPDVICIGELRDQETISLAMSAAETGHLVLGTLHTSSTIRTINRIVGVYPPSQQGQVRTMLSESLRAVVSQRLLPTTDDNGVALAIELLLVNNAVGNLIRENQTFQIASILQTGASKGMKMLDTSLRELVTAGRISKQTAAENAEKPDQFA